ncbi:spore germination protein KB [Paenibacillus endophyticus]|uniref:Spore germination protein KB n=1 Tax=Paenibacillus endophyticus TaxID=1294268 RepID=A0A7W5G9B3_9BACL|nr:endospore germination permease [Paenibacillus endophyticus]MBB3151540.1 spore germination protein KB [Paenibacillus endophyticus]
MVQGRISAFQLSILMFQLILSSSVLLMPSISTALSGKDMWMTPILSSALGFFTIWMVLKIHEISPNGSFLELLETTCGRWVGKCFSLAFILFQIHIVAITIRDYGEFIVTNFFLKTPVQVIIGAMLLLCAWVVKSGIEVMARTGQIFIPVITLCTLVICILLIPELDPTEILPIFERGAAPIAKGTVVVAGWFCQLSLILFILPLVKDVKEVRKWGYLAVTGIMLMMLIANLTAFLLMGESTAFFNYPLLTASRYIAYAEFFEHVEAVVMMVWVLGEFFKISFYYYAICKGLEETCRVSKPEALVLPVCVLLFTSTFWLAKDFQTVGDFIAVSGTLYILAGNLIFPLCIFFVARMKLRFKMNQT